MNDPATTLSGIAADKGYSELWAKRSEKPLQQIYGHIDRISNKEAGSLLDRYADRFGHSLDREIIVMRKAAVEEKVAEIRDAPLLNSSTTNPKNQSANFNKSRTNCGPSNRSTKKRNPSGTRKRWLNLHRRFKR